MGRLPVLGMSTTAGKYMTNFSHVDDLRIADFGIPASIDWEIFMLKIIHVKNFHGLKFSWFIPSAKFF